MVYWQQQLKKCRKKSLKPFYEKALLTATQCYNHHSLTPTNNNPLFTGQREYLDFTQ